MGKRPDIVWEAKCWANRKVVLYRDTLKGHVLHFHMDSAFVVDALKRNFHQPICVVDIRHHGTENAIYDIECGGHKLLLVAVKFHGLTGKLARKANFIKSFYGVSKIPEGRVLWGKRP